MEEETREHSTKEQVTEEFRREVERILERTILPLRERVHEQERRIAALEAIARDLHRTEADPKDGDGEEPGAPQS